MPDAKAAQSKASVPAGVDCFPEGWDNGIPAEDSSVPVNVEVPNL
jgi:hypothetical protein